MIDGLTFDEAEHRYAVDDVPVPSVTQVLNDIIGEYRHVDPDVLEAARQFGTHAHQATDLFDKGELDHDSLDVALLPYLNGWREFLIDHRARVIESELRVYHPTLRVAGTLDKLVDWNGLCQIDLKTGIVPRTVGLQTSAYQELLSFHPKFTTRVRRRYCLQLTGLEFPSYRLFPQKNLGDWPLFVSCLNVFRFRHPSGSIQ